MTTVLNNNIITKLSDRDHLLKRPGMYIGSVRPETTQSYFYNSTTGKFEYKSYQYIPGLIKIICEIIDNSLDEADRTNYQYATNISIDITDTTVQIKDDGRGVPLDIDKATGLSMLELAFTHAKAGSNFDDDVKKLIGTNGVGSFATNCFSKVFNVESCTGTKKGVLKCTDNLKDYKYTLTKGSKKNIGTTVFFEPDLAKFGQTIIDETHKSIIYQRLLFLAVSFPAIKFTFNKKPIVFKNSKSLMETFDDNYVVVDSDNYMIGIIPNNTDDFLQVSYINGLDLKKGGNHIDYIHSEIVTRLKDKLSRKYKDIKPGDIKNKLQYVVIFKNFPKPEFDSQTKVQLTNATSDIKTFLSDVDWDKLTVNLMKKDAIINPIIDTYKIKEELKLRQTLKTATKGSRNFKCEKYIPATGSKKMYLLICEGDSAVGGCSEAFGRDGIGYYSSKGVPLNGYVAPVQKIMNNVEFTDIIKILNLQLNGQMQQLDYQYVILANDQDADRISHKRTLFRIFY